jgi:hypothetical protein
MRCEDLTRELASPTGALSPAQMAGHLAVCPACAEWSRRASQVDRIWEATRPVEPSMDALDALWAHASLELDGLKAAPATLKFERRNTRRAMVSFLAMAAAILVAAVVLLQRDGVKRVEVAVKTPATVEAKEPELLDLKVEPDVLAVVRIGKDNAIRIEKDDLSQLYNSPSLPVATPHDEIDSMEATGSSWAIASK